MTRLILATLAVAAIACAPALACDASFTGLASFYDRSSGRETASGEAFNDRAMTAAHRCLPFGTKLKVRWRGREIVVRINDRGPFIPGRVIDLSQGAARSLGMIDAGVAKIEAEVIP